MKNIEDTKAPIAMIQDALSYALRVLTMPPGGLFKPRDQVEIAASAVSWAQQATERLEKALSRPVAGFSEACPGVGSSDLEKALLGRSAGSGLFADGP